MREEGPTYVEQVMSNLVRNCYQRNFDKDLISMSLNASKYSLYISPSHPSSSWLDTVAICGGSYRYVQSERYDYCIRLHVELHMELHGVNKGDND